MSRGRWRVQVLPLGQLVEMLLATGASLIQPTLRHPVGPHAQRHDPNSSCMAVQTRVASMDSPIFRVEAWTLFYQLVLSAARGRFLSSHVSGLNLLWCPLLRLMHPRRVGCAEAASIPALRLRGGADQCAGRACLAMVEEWMARSHVTRARPVLARQLISRANESEELANGSCWGANYLGGLTWRRRQY